MKKTLWTSMVILLGLTFLVSAAFGQEITKSGFLGNPSVYNELKPVEGGTTYRWIKQDVDFKKYNRFMVDSVIFFLADKAQYKGIDPQEMKEMADEFNKQLVAAFKARNLPIVADPGPDVARIRLAITNVQPSNPGTSVISSILPIGLGVSLIKRGATGGWVGSGQTSVEMQSLDSISGTVIAMGADTRAAAFDERFSKWGSANDAFKFWAERIATAIDALHGKGTLPPLKI